MAKDCRGHAHPRRRKPVSRRQVRSELRRMWRDSGSPGRFSLEWTDDLARTHERNRRRYAQVAPFARGGAAFELAPQATYLPPRNRRGLLAHEVGHVLDPHGSEAAADRAAAEVLGVDVGYDRRWPGKGLQVALNPGKKTCEVLFEENGSFVWKKGRLVGIDEGLMVVKVGGELHKRIPKHVRGCPKIRKTPSGRHRRTTPGTRPPPFRYVRNVTGKRKDIVEISMFTVSGDEWLGSLKFRKGRGRKAYVMKIDVVTKYRGHYLATRLYEAAAKEVWQDGLCLASDTQLRVGSRAFWEKQVRKGRAELVGKRYELCAPPPKTLKNPRFPVEALWGRQGDRVTVLGPAFPEGDSYFVIVAPWGEEVIAPATELFTLEGRRWQERRPPPESRAWANNPELPSRREGSLPAPVPAGVRHPPRGLSFEALVKGEAPLSYLPEGARERPQVTRALQAMLALYPGDHPLAGIPRMATPDAWEDLLAAAGLAADVYVVDRNGGLWKVKEVLFDPGRGETGRLVLRHQGPLARHGDRTVDLWHVVGNRLLVPIVQYKPVKRPPRRKNPREWKVPPPCDPKATGRQLDAKRLKGDQVRIHVNLHNGCYVVSNRGLVAGYAKALTLKGVGPKVSQGGWEKCNTTKVRNVHAWLEGAFVSQTATVPRGKGWRRVSYNCKERGPNFYYTDDDSVFEGAQEVRFCRKKGIGMAQIEVWAKGAPPRKKNPGCPCALPGGACRCGAVDRWWLEEPPGCECP